MSPSSKSKLKDDVIQMLTQAANLLCDPTDRTAVKAVDVGDSITFVVESTHPGALIGKGGRTVEALRLVLMSIGSRCHVKVALEVGSHPAQA